MCLPFDDVDRLCVNTLRGLAIDMVETARSGHPGLPLGAAPMAYVLWQRHLRFDPSDPAWPDRDRFVLSAGHGSALLYALLHAYGFDLPLDELRRFRQWGSRTPGHPEHGLTPGVEATTGPLGQGTAVSVGMAIAERFLAARTADIGERLVDHVTWALVSDGDLMEGISAEAGSLAGHLGLGKLVYLYDSNGISLDGPTAVTFTEDVAARYRAYGWHVLDVADGDHDLDGIDAALTAARAETDRPSLVIVHTTIGYGAPHKAGSHAAHGSPLGADEAAATKRALGLDPGRSFDVPAPARTRFAAGTERGREARRAWRARVEQLDAEQARRLEQTLSAPLPDGWADALPSWDAGEKIATRAAAGKALAALAERIPSLLGGDADLGSSTKTRLPGEADFDGRTGAGRNIRFGVREHAMGAIANGLAYHGGVRPFTATFLAFSDYMRPPIRLAALDGLRVVFVFTHDSIGVGEDGPTHQPVEQVAALRAIPDLSVVRPADAHEAREAWCWAVERARGPVALVLTRQSVPVLEQTASSARDGLRRGGYVLADVGSGRPRVVLVATGSEVHLALEAADALANDGIATRVVSMPCRETFEAQPPDYREQVLPRDREATVVVEAGVSLGWGRYLVPRGAFVGVERFGASAPGGEVLARYGLTADAIAEAARGCLAGR
ncbi:MAG: transketolase [Acidobacteria bacterium]|nr:MAG: transketolase [Acidobacteriota bacterium]